MAEVLTGGRYLDDSGEAWKAATGHAQSMVLWTGGPGRTCDMGAAPHGPRPDLACDVPWCLCSAVWSWERTAAELKRMRGPKVKGVAAEAQPERRLCALHRPTWRAEYVPLGQVRPAVAAPAVKAARKGAPAAAPALSAALDELADTRAQLEAARAELVRHRDTWRAYTSALDELRQLRAELSALTAPAGAPVDVLAELVA